MGWIDDSDGEKVCWFPGATQRAVNCPLTLPRGTMKNCFLERVAELFIDELVGGSK